MTIHFKPEVKIIADSLNCGGDRLTTFQLKYWRPLLPEMNTHRVFSRNASSSRAAGTERMFDEVLNEIWLPKHWNAEQKGMQGGEEFDPYTQAIIDQEICELSRFVVDRLKTLDEQVQRRTGRHIHKQYLNRYTEPFRAVNQLVSSTDWENFFKLRTSSLAQPEMQDLALDMYILLHNSEPKWLKEGELHLPYVTEQEKQKYDVGILAKISTARCARVCYRPYEGNTTLEKDIALHDQLLANGHMSPFEHVAMADGFGVAPNQWNNFNGWRQYRDFVKTAWY